MGGLIGLFKLACDCGDDCRRAASVIVVVGNDKDGTRPSLLAADNVIEVHAVLSRVRTK